MTTMHGPANRLIRQHIAEQPCHSCLIVNIQCHLEANIGKSGNNVNNMSIMCQCWSMPGQCRIKAVSEPEITLFRHVGHVKDVSDLSYLYVSHRVVWRNSKNINLKTRNTVYFVSIYKIIRLTETWGPFYRVFRPLARLVRHGSSACQTCHFSMCLAQGVGQSCQYYIYFVSVLQNFQFCQYCPDTLINLYTFKTKCPSWPFWHP